MCECVYVYVCAHILYSFQSIEAQYVHVYLTFSIHNECSYSCSSCSPVKLKPAVFVTAAVEY